MWSECSWEMTMPSRCSTDCSITASRRSVSFLPRPASTSRRVDDVSSNVQLPELPDARMLTRRLMRSPRIVPPEMARAAGIMAERADSVNGFESRIARFPQRSSQHPALAGEGGHCTRDFQGTGFVLGAPGFAFET